MKFVHNSLTKGYYSLPHLCMLVVQPGDIRVLEEWCSKVRSIVATYAVSAPGERDLHHQPPAGPLLSTAPCTCHVTVDIDGNMLNSVEEK